MAWGREQAREAERRYRASHRVALNARESARRAADPERHLAAVKRSQAKYPDKKRALHRQWRQRPGNRIGFNLRRNLHQALKVRASGRDWRSDAKLKSIIGCSKAELIAHIERQFQPGMSWDNYGRGGWEMDHIKPCASFDLTDHEQVSRCFHYTNLRPLWQSANVRRLRRET
jgi:hypothetical protein